MRRVPRILGSVFLALMALGAVAAHAVDGVLEIGQTCAVSTGVSVAPTRSTSRESTTIAPERKTSRYVAPKTQLVSR